jgi:ABC-type glycerol-3-phosphate transport system substrate-binding protein
MPDVLVLNSRDLKTAAQEGLVQPIDAYMPADAGYFPSALAAVQTEEALWAFPYVAKADQMAYRRGLTTTAPLSWTTVVSANYTLLFPAAPAEGLASDSLLSIYMGSGGRVVDQAGQASLDRATLELVYGFFLAMQDAGLLDAELALSLPNASTCWDRFQEGQGELTPVPVTRFWQTRPEDALPSWPPTAEGTRTTILHTWGLAIVTQDPVRRDAAVELVRWLVSAQHMAELSLVTELVPTRTSAVDAWPVSPEDAAFVKSLLSSSTAALPASVDASVRRALQAGLTVLLEREVETPAEAASYALTNLRR